MERRRLLFTYLLAQMACIFHKLIIVFILIGPKSKTHRVLMLWIYSCWIARKHRFLWIASMYLSEFIIQSDKKQWSHAKELKQPENSFAAWLKWQGLKFHPQIFPYQLCFPCTKNYIHLVSCRTGLIRFYPYISFFIVSKASSCFFFSVFSLFDQPLSVSIAETAHVWLRKC